jgi:hypothetical protein
MGFEYPAAEPHVLFPVSLSKDMQAKPSHNSLFYLFSTLTIRELMLSYSLFPFDFKSESLGPQYLGRIHINWRRSTVNPRIFIGERSGCCPAIGRGQVRAVERCEMAEDSDRRNCRTKNFQRKIVL